VKNIYKERKEENGRNEKKGRKNKNGGKRER
jgi:hypothetical protein